MIEIREYPPFRRWLSGLPDEATKAVIARRLMRLSVGNFGDAKSVGGGVSELRIDYGPGFRVYFAREGPRVVLLLGGGDKSTQHLDIRKAQALWAEIKRTQA
ncbi:type II toxin-antitoxin system RelE/ParE family toxin [Cupriavidus gilardii]|uniref:Type II toxin-antitoxin system RelE/ParE family toxin n=1 Tax=Cupriavidus gilardii TaxID=82541 RepID=A0ABY4VMU4_9BURK|nr:type II toxin-antitoxin system RelE/ParE family toxin [Cupriavidus gilardii]QQE09676.1 type II toxin-antitoxin system RelE/ParE family toxin [Cupriavidus sp. ISTL7]MCT9073566.1 type II toxin-antitoxin system RelE/ParE family toxin [Cupriavidus gilardii]MCT9117795.1 type II toxin-antitoxin system RelE/ParE family toxin [Cupriavidus gilardii]QKS61429.1 type II toxin-antitoxin system RelE/ParE family toxin [Cupriavidus gilardii]USE77622.1 type II toxin-antitoxin system RelE/ParE family toxin [